jgi:NTP pyrophosphatase (non-canonical NTP hydrolase)
MNTDTSWSQMDECLVILAEECSEVIQAVSKTMRFPEDDIKNRARLEKELGDLQCMIDLTCKHLDIDQESVVLWSNIKAEKLKQWSNLMEPRCIE